MGLTFEARHAGMNAAASAPAAIIASASRKARRMAEAPEAPSVRRRPISRVRRVTTKDITPVETDQREQQGQRAKAAGEGGQEALGGERAIDLVVQSAEPQDRQSRVVLLD